MIQKGQVYQWRQGTDHEGEMEIVAEADGYLVRFDSGRELPRSEVQHKMTRAGVPDPDGGMAGAVQAVPDLDSLPEWLRNDPSVTPGANAPPVAQPPPKKSLVGEILDKQKDHDEVELTLTIPVRMPKREVYDLLMSMFDPDEVVTELAAAVAPDITTDEFREGVGAQLADLLKTHYNGTS